MILLAKILGTMAIVGLFGCFYNALTGKDPNDWRNHVYSSIMMGIPAIFGIGYIFYLIWFKF